MRLQHLTQIAGGLLSDGPERAAAKAVIVEEVERLRWRLWNGRAKDAKVSIDRIRAVMHHFRGEPGSRRSIAPWDCREIGGHAAAATLGSASFAAKKRCPKPVPSVPL